MPGRGTPIAEHGHEASACENCRCRKRGGIGRRRTLGIAPCRRITTRPSSPVRHSRSICSFVSEQVSFADVARYTILSIGDVNHMSKEEDYRLTAAEIVECAQQAKSILEKRRLLRLAEMWLDLAARSGRKTAQAQRRLEDHPLVRKTLGNGPAGVS
jgi:hypothetical protein